VPFQAFPAKDGWLVIACPKEKFWRRLTGVLGRPDLADNERYATFSARRVHAAELLAVLEELFLARTVEQWLADLRAAGVPCGPVNSVADALADPHTAARGMVVETDHPRFGRIRQVRSPVRVGSQEPTYRRAPRPHEDADRVLRDLLRYSDDTVEDLAASGAFGARQSAVAP
jgi:crotonobetainyl-CoA:carnitine CoA-transferase CaiB-like acyl-CoA transferase